MYSGRMIRNSACALAVCSAVAWIGAVALEEPPAQIVVREATEQLLDSISREKEVIDVDKARLYAIVEEIVLPHFDFTKMSQRVLGRHWREATEEQRAQFQDAFRDLLVRTYATALSEYRDQSIVYLPMRERGEGGEVSVRTRIEPPGGAPIPIFYEMYPIADKWKVYDVTIDGVSLVINYRSSFSNEIRRNGMDSLITRLAEMNRRALERSGGSEGGI